MFGCVHLGAVYHMFFSFTATFFYAMAFVSWVFGVFHWLWMAHPEWRRWAAGTSDLR